MRLFKRSQASAPKCSFCETATAGPYTPNHIRRVGPEGLKPSGISGALTLCGRLVGWDLVSVEPTAETLTEMRTRWPDNPAARVCTTCDARFRAGAS